MDIFSPSDEKQKNSCPTDNKQHGACPWPSPGIINDSEFFTSERKTWTRNLAMIEDHLLEAVGVVWNEQQISLLRTEWVASRLSSPARRLSQSHLFPNGTLPSTGIGEVRADVGGQPAAHTISPRHRKSRFYSIPAL